MCPSRLRGLCPVVLPLSLNSFFVYACRFNQGEGQVENAIITSTGQYVIAWDFEKVKKGKLDKYDIKKSVATPALLRLGTGVLSCFTFRYEDHVVQDNFKFGDDKNIVSNPSALSPLAVDKTVLHLQDRGAAEQRPCRQQGSAEEANSKVPGCG